MAGGLDKASKLRKVIQGIVNSEIKKVNPPPRLGAVIRIDRENDLCWVQFRGESTLATIKITPGTQPRYAAYDVSDGSSRADIVRVGGRPGNYYLLDVVTTASLNLETEKNLEFLGDDIADVNTTLNQQAGIIGGIDTDLAALEAEVSDIGAQVGSDGLAPMASPVPKVYAGSGAVVVDFTPIKIGVRSTTTNPEQVKYEVHATYDNAVVPSTSTLVTLDGLPPTWIRKMPDGNDVISATTVYVSIVAYDKDGKASPSAWVAVTPLKIGDNDLKITEQTLIANFALIEAMKLVDLFVSGDLTASTFTGIGKASFRDAANELAQGSGLYMRSKTSAPTTPPSVSEYVPTVSAAQGGANSSARNHGDIYQGKYYTPEVISTGVEIAAYDLVTGARTVVKTIALTESQFSVGFVFMDNVWYHWIRSTGSGSPSYSYQTFDVNWNQTNSGVGTAYATNPSANSYYIFGKSDYGRLIVAALNNANYYSFIQELIPATGAVDATVRMSNGNTFPDLGDFEKTTVMVGNFDFGARRIIWSTSVKTYAYSYAFARLASDDIVNAPPSNAVSHLAWDGTRFWHMATDQAKVRTIYRYTTAYWTAVARDTLWISGTWANDVSTLRETLLGSKRTKWLPRKRWAMRLTYADFPSAANKIGVYVGTGATEPTAYNAYMLQVYSGSKFVNVELGPVVSGTAPPDPANNTRDFTGGTSARIAGDDGSYWTADGEHKFDPSKDKGRFIVKVQRRTTQNLPAGVETNLAAMTVDYDTYGGLYAAKTINGYGGSDGTATLTAPVAGRYRIRAKVRISSGGASAGRRGLTIKRVASNGTFIANVDEHFINPPPFQAASVYIDVEENLNAGDYIYLTAYQNTSDTQTLVVPGSQENNNTYMSLQRVG